MSFAVFVISVMNSLIQVLLAPIDALLSSIVPSFDTLSQNVADFISYFYDTFVFVINWLHIPAGAIAILISYISFRVFLFFGTLGFKLCLKWYHLLKQ